MYIHLKVFPGQRRSVVEKITDTRFKVYVKAKAERGLANDEALNLVADFLRCPRAKVKIISGINTPNKLISLAD